MENTGLLSEIDGDYQGIRILGSGSTGSVCLAVDRHSGELCSVKRVDRDNPLYGASLQEYEILNRLKHESIPKALNYMDRPEAVYIVIQYFEGTPLDALIAKSGRIAAAEAVSWVLQLCDILTCLHSVKPYPIVYRDLKPSNILLTKDGSIKLIDFGAACIYKKEERYDAVYLGTKGYAAPEQYYGGRSSPAADIYGLGMTFRTMLTGLDPGRPDREKEQESSRDLDRESNWHPDPEHESEQERFIVQDMTGAVSDELFRIIARCTMTDPSKRFKDVAEVSESIKEAIHSTRSFPAKNGSAHHKTCECPKTQLLDSFAPKSGKTIIAVWDNPCFASEFSYLAAKIAGLKVILADLDLFSPSMDLLLDVQKSPAGSPGFIPTEGGSGLCCLVEALSRDNCKPGFIETCCVKRRPSDNLYVLTGNYSLEDYEYFNDSMVIRLIEHASCSFDITVLSTGKFIYDSFNVISLIKADIVLVPLIADLCRLREFCRYSGFLEEKQRLDFRKTRFIAFDYDPSTDLDRSMIDEITGGRFSGSIRRDRRRDLARSSGDFFAAGMSKQSVREYVELMKNIGILQSRKG